MNTDLSLDSYYKIRRGRPAAESALQTLPESMVGLRSSYENQQKQFSRAFDVLRDAIEQQAFPGAALAVAHQGKLMLPTALAALPTTTRHR